MINGVQPATFWLLPMLGKHPDEYPRFRDCFPGLLSNSTEVDQFNIPKKSVTRDNFISVYMRIGGGNREYYETEIAELQNSPHYLKDYDDDFDNTFATFVFLVPVEFLEDFVKIIQGKLLETSQKYQDILYKVYPKLTEKFNSIFNAEVE
jgi:hypothetical protein